MEAEELIKYLKKCCESEIIGDKFEPIIIPTKGDPTKQQYDVSIIIMEKVKEGRIPRFRIDVKDLEGIRNLNKLN